MTSADGRPGRRARLVVPVVVLLGLTTAGCAGQSAYERCVQHSVDEGVDRGVVEQACREVGTG